MTNPMAAMLNLNKLSGQLAPIKQMMTMVRTASNPQAMLNQLMQSNPQMQQVNQLVQQYGDPQKAFMALAEQQGVDPAQILQMLNNI